MAKLFATIDWDKGTIRFSGSGTYDARESIKSLGVARWLRNEKAWEISSSDISKDTLLAKFPDIEIEAIGEESQALKDTRPSVLTTSQSTPRESLTGLPDSLAVSELLCRVRAVLSEAFPQSICLRGVLTSVNFYQDRVFMDLGDPDGERDRIGCVIWQNVEAVCVQLTKAGFTLERDLPVMFEGHIDLSRRDGRLSFQVRRIVSEYTVAKLEAEREITNARLQKEGIFCKNKELSLPMLPKRFGILTSAGGTVINDFRASLDVASFGFDLFWLPVGVQGENAVSDIVRGLQQLGTDVSLDAILLFRGGGSPAELSVFNNYDVARAVCLCPIPVVSAIGHERDQSSVQDASCRHFGVPKDIGRFFADIVLDLRRRVAEAAKTCAAVATQTHDIAFQRFSALGVIIQQSLVYLVSLREDVVRRFGSVVPALSATTLAYSVRRFIDVGGPLNAIANSAVLRWQKELLSSGQKFSFGIERVVDKAQERVERTMLIKGHAERFVKRGAERMHNMERIVENAKPEVQLARGFVLISRPDSDGFVTQGSGLKKKELLNLKFHDVVRKAEISE